MTQKLIRGEDVIELDEVAKACKAAADDYEEFAKGASGELSQIFIHLAAAHRSQVSTLDHLMRGMGELPTRPDTDRETLARLGVWLRAAIADSQHEVLLKRAEDNEREVKAAAESALLKSLPEKAEPILRDIQSRADEALICLSKEKPK